MVIVVGLSRRLCTECMNRFLGFSFLSRSNGDCRLHIALMNLLVIYNGTE